MTNAVETILNGPGTDDEKMAKVAVLFATPEAEANRARLSRALELLVALYRKVLSASGAPAEMIDVVEKEIEGWSVEDAALAARYCDKIGEGIGMMKGGIVAILLGRLVKRL